MCARVFWETAEEGGGVRGAGCRGGAPSPSPPPAGLSSCRLGLRPLAAAQERNVLTRESGAPASAAINTANIWRETKSLPARYWEKQAGSARPPPPRSPAGLSSSGRSSHTAPPGSPLWPPLGPQARPPPPRCAAVRPAGRGGAKQADARRASRSPAPAPGGPGEGSNCLNQIRTRCPGDFFPTRPKYLWFEKVRRTFFFPAPLGFPEQCCYFLGFLRSGESEGGQQNAHLLIVTRPARQGLGFFPWVIFPPKDPGVYKHLYTFLGQDESGQDTFG